MKITRYFTNIRYTIPLIIVIILYITVATFLPLNQEGEIGLEAIRALGVTDIYKTPVFIILISMLIINIMICTYHRLGPTWRLVSHPNIRRSLESIKNEKHYTANIGIDEILAKIKKAGYSVTSEDTKYAFAQKGVLCRWGATITHIGLIIVLLAGIAKGIWGSVGTMKIFSGYEKDVYYDWNKKDFLPLGFKIKADKVSVTYHTPRVYLGLYDLEKGRELDDMELNIGEEKKLVLGGQTYTVLAKEFLYDAAVDPAGMVNMLSDLLGNPAVIVKINDGIEDYFFCLFNDSSKNKVTPESRVQPILLDSKVVMDKAEAYVTLDGGESVYINANTASIYNGRSIYLADIGRDQFHNKWLGLQLVYDPTINFVWFGFAVMMIGVICSFYISHKRIWLYDDGDKIYLTGNVLGNRPGFKNELEGYVS